MNSIKIFGARLAYNRYLPAEPGMRRGVMRLSVDIGRYTLAWCAPAYLAVFRDGVALTRIGKQRYSRVTA